MVVFNKEKITSSVFLENERSVSTDYAIEQAINAEHNV